MQCQVINTKTIIPQHINLHNIIMEGKKDIYPPLANFHMIIPADENDAIKSRKSIGIVLKRKENFPNMNKYSCLQAYQSI